MSCRKVGSLMWQPRSHLVVWERKNCAPSRREAHVEIKIAKTPQVRTDLEVEMSKQCTRLWREARFSKSKRRKHTIIGTILEAEMFKKCTPLWREAHLDVKIMKKTHVRTTFGHSSGVLCGTRNGFSTWWKVRFCHVSTTMAGVGRLKRICKHACCVADAVQAERGCFLEHQIFRFPKMIARDTCSTLHDLTLLFGGRRNTLEKLQNALARSCRLSTGVSIFEGRLAELLRCSCCQLPNLK